MQVSFCDLHSAVVYPQIVRLRFSGVFPLTLCAVQIYLLTYLLTYPWS